MKFTAWLVRWLSRCPKVTLAMMKHHDQKQAGEERVYSAYTFLSPFIIEEGRDRNMEAGTDAEAVQGCCLSACSSWLAQPEDLGPLARSTMGLNLSH